MKNWQFDIEKYAYEFWLRAEYEYANQPTKLIGEVVLVRHIIDTTNHQWALDKSQINTWMQNSFLSNSIKIIILIYIHAAPQN